MPLYEYECSECGHRTELLQRFDDPPLAECPECGGPVRRLLSAPAVQFKGSGWYVTDYAGKGKKASAAESAADGSEKAGKSDKASDGSKKEKPAAAAGSSSASSKPAAASGD